MASNAGYKGTAPAIEMYFTSSWVDVTADVRISAGIVAKWGMRNQDPISARLAEAGLLTFTLDNAITNSGGLVGYYSPDNANVRAGFSIGTPVRLKLTGGGTFYKKFYINSITPAWGSTRERSVAVQCTDYIGKMQGQFANGLTVQTTKRIDEALTTLIATMPIAPSSTSYATAPDSIAYMFQDIDSRKTTVYNAAQRLLQTDLGYLFCEGDGTNGETLTYQSRHTRLTSTLEYTFQDEIQDIKLLHADNMVYNSVSVVAYPLNVGSSPEVLWVLQKELSLNAGASTTIRVRYRDPSSEASKVTLEPSSGVTPVADTDYKMSSAAGGSGNDLNASLGVSVTWYADNAVITYTNNHASATGYINTGQLRGNIIRKYDPTESNRIDIAANLERYGTRELRFALPYLDNPNTADDFADYFFSLYSAPVTRIDEVLISANFSSTAWNAVCTGLRIGDRVAVTEPVLGVTAQEYDLCGIEITIAAGNILSARYFLKASGEGEFWFLGTSGLSELGETTLLGF